MNSYGCLDTSINTVNILPIPQVDFSYFKQDTCGHFDTSSASITVIGGIKPYTYDWYNFDSQPTTQLQGFLRVFIIVR